MRKKYISTGANPLSVDIPTDKGAIRTFDFRGGLHQLQKPPVYTTTDPEEQRLLESYVSFNKSYVLEQTIVQESPVAELQEAEVKSFANTQDAKDWLNKEHSVPFNQITNKGKVIAKALELGVQVEFQTDKE